MVSGTIFRLIWTGILLFLSSCSIGNISGSAIQESFLLDVDPMEAKALVDSGVFVLDVRTESEFSQGHIDGAVNMDVNSKNFHKLVAGLDSSEPYLVYCRTGRRSLTAAQMLKELGFKRVYNLEDGINAWTNAGFAVLN